MEDQQTYSVAIVGAGPAGLFAASEMAKKGIHVTLFNRDIKPGGLAEYGVYPQKYRLREGFRTQFEHILESNLIDYYGNVWVHQDGDLTLEDIRDMGFHAILVTVGAQGTKWLGLPGEKLKGVYHAKELVYHYNKLPPYSQEKFLIGKKVAIIGVGNVMMDIARYVVTEVKADEVIAIARRGPGEVKFDKGELDAVARNIDLVALKAEIERARPLVGSLSQDIEKPLTLIEKVLPEASWSGSTTHFILRFLLSPVRILGDQAGRVCGIELEENRLEEEDGEIRAQPTGNCRIVDVDTVIFAIGDRVDDGLGLPVEGNLFAKNPNPRFPMENNSYEVLDPETCKAIEDVFVAGWARRASTGLVGITRRDGINGARALMSYLDTLTSLPVFDAKKVKQRLALINRKVVNKQDLQQLRGVENEIAKQLGVPEYKFATDEEMLHAIDNRLNGLL